VCALDRNILLAVWYFLEEDEFYEWWVLERLQESCDGGEESGDKNQQRQDQGEDYSRE
jgi:hypothetical protein